MNPAQNYTSQAAYEAAMAFYSQALASWPIPARERIVETQVGDTFVVSWGNPANPPLVLLHGSAANSSTWLPDAACFGEVFRVFAIDLPGEAGRSTCARPLYAGTTYPEWLADVFDQLELDSASICGLSLGGWAGLKFAATFPERVDRLALLAPGGVVSARESFEAAAEAALSQGEAGLRHMAELVFAPQAPPPGVAEAFVLMHGIYIARRESLPGITDAELAKVRAPVLLLGGAKDAVLDMPATDARLRRSLARYESEIDPAAGHAILGKGERVRAFLAG